MRLAIALTLLALLAACSMLPETKPFFATGGQQQDAVAEGESDNIVNITASNLNQSVNEPRHNAVASINRQVMTSNTNGAYKARPLTKHIGDYVRVMARNLVSNMDSVNDRTSIAVTNFALIDSNLKETNLLGQQMAESFVHEFHQSKMSVVDFKATQFIRVTQTGDYVLSRDYMELKNSTPIKYVLTGTLTKHQGGYLVNARMLGMQSNIVVASAQSFIPFYVVDALLPSGATHEDEAAGGVAIVSGE